MKYGNCEGRKRAYSSLGDEGNKKEHTKHTEHVCMCVQTNVTLPCVRASSTLVNYFLFCFRTQSFCLQEMRTLKQSLFLLGFISPPFHFFFTLVKASDLSQIIQHRHDVLLRKEANKSK